MTPKRWVRVVRNVPVVLREERERLGYTQAVPAEALELSQGQLSKLESGQSAMTLGQFLRLCEVYGILPESILRRADERGR